MNKQWAFAAGCILFFSCGGSSDKAAVPPSPQQQAAMEKQRFFPVTDFILGEIKNIAKAGVNPLRTVTTGTTTDSSWLKLEELPQTLSAFTSPVIDSTNLISLFTETKFQDQTINTFTFTHEPTGKLPDSLQLMRWDVHIDPETGTVKRVYMVKRIKENGTEKTQQLTWLTGKWCKTVTIAPQPDGSGKVEKEETILWDFSNQ